MSGRLTSKGKPMRALAALAGTTASQPLTESGVWLVCRDTHGPKVTWHAPLGDLVARGLAVRTGRRGGYEWYITQAGLELLVAEGLLPAGGEW